MGKKFCVMFAGQSVQAPGMCQELWKLPAARDILERLKPSLGDDLEAVTTDMPADELALTFNAQRAIRPPQNRLPHDKWRHPHHMIRRRHLPHERVVGRQPFLPRNDEMRVGADELVLQIVVKTAHHRDYHYQGGHPDGYTEHGNHAD